MIERIKESYSKLYDKQNWRGKMSQELCIDPESLRIYISSETLPKKHRAKVLISLGREIAMQEAEIKKAMNIEVIEPQIIKP